MELIPSLKIKGMLYTVNVRFQVMRENAINIYFLCPHLLMSNHLKEMQGH